MMLASLAAAPPAQAVEVASLFTAQVFLDPEADDPRADAYSTALREVVLRVAGSELAGDSAALDLLFPSPAAYVVQFRPGGQDTLWVAFDGAAIEQTLRQAGQTVWGSERPLTLVWLAVDWGQGEREIIAADDPESSADAARSIDRNRLLRQRVLDVAERRGLPVVFPLLDTDDLQKIGFSDIWGGFDEQLLDASRRYDAPSVLVGRVRPGSSQRNRWNYYFAGEESSFNGEPELVINLVADRLVAELAISSSAPLQSIELRVAGIDSVSAYGSVQNLLAGLPIVEDFSITSVNGDEIRYRVESRGGPERLRRTLRLNGLAEQDRFDDGGFSLDSPSESLRFFFSPEQPQL
jgi:hypothetical protein